MLLPHKPINPVESKFPAAPGPSPAHICLSGGEVTNDLPQESIQDGYATIAQALHEMDWHHKEGGRIYHEYCGRCLQRFPCHDYAQAHKTLTTTLKELNIHSATKIQELEG